RRDAIDLAADHALRALDGITAIGLQMVGEVRVRAHHHLLVATLARARTDLPEDLGGQRRVRLDDPIALAGRTWRAEQRLQALPHALARHLHEPELRALQHVRPRLVLGEHPGQRAEYLVPMLGPLHVDEVDDDDAPEIPEADLADHLGDRLEVDLEDGLL